MAFSTFRLDEYSFAQIEEILEQRNRSGFHAYYEDGYDQNKFVCIAPWYMSNGSMLTSVLRYPSKKTGELTDNSEISLGRYNRHRYDRIKILFEKNNAIFMDYVRDENSKDKVKLTDKNVIGSHVFRFVRGDDELTDPAYFNSVKNYFFSHQGVWLRMGGYALWNGKWKPGTKVSARDNDGNLYAGEIVVPPSGTMLAMLKVYYDGCAFLDAADATTTRILRNKYRSLACYKLLTGHG
ncbi:uncharacterized protein LOC142577974 isoform X2 [Dermacentor variabilis]|uniref:uncharacterized protein LOC142577974 isoform X2 n=1 Tax=Dermacentor variabilis TaxID=34621 RepID=UPI003F5C0940